MVEQVKGWFSLPGRPGDRTYEQQLLGLDWLFANVSGKTVLDVGCAEGLISIKLLREHGALGVHGIEMVHERVETARRLATKAGLRDFAQFDVGNMDTWRPVHAYDVVIGLAILHKLKEPSACAARLAECAKEAVVLRLPPSGATIVDRRSGNVPHCIGDVMRDSGFRLHQQSNDGPYGEYVGVWLR